MLRRLNDADFALIEPHLAAVEASPNDLLYSPGDDVETVHFPCGPSLVSYMVTNEDGRDVETILIGREGAVGGIVSQGYLPAYTRIMRQIRRALRAAAGRQARCGESRSRAR